MIKLICKNCGKEYIPFLFCESYNNNAYCSKECQDNMAQKILIAVIKENWEIQKKEER